MWGSGVQKLWDSRHRGFVSSDGKFVRIQRFEDIEAWQLAREQTRKVYDLTKNPELPFEVLSSTSYHISKVNKIKITLNAEP